MFIYRGKKILRERKGDRVNDKIRKTTKYFIISRKYIKGSENANKENTRADFTFSELNNYKATNTLSKIQNFQKTIKI